MPEEIFIRILNNSVTETEKSNFYRELEENRSLREQFFQFKSIYTVSTCQYYNNIGITKDRFEHIWGHLHPGKKYFIINLWYRYAAIVVVTIVFSFMVQYLVNNIKSGSEIVEQVEYTSEKGSVSTIHLSDGSSVWLSSASGIKIQKRSNGEMSAQMHGEAFFDLVPDSKRKFSVDMGSFKVKDIGTKFNIRAYRDEAGIYTSLADGKIEFLSKSDQLLLAMKTGEYMSFDKQSKKMMVSERDPSIASAWKNGKFVFIDKTLKEICHDLENWYNVKIVIENKTLADTRYTSVIKRTTTIKLVLQMLALTDKINYKITDKKEGNDVVLIY
ncbi:MAG: FecR family protein [Prolixibacteraceae bacterium]|jgi:ferric-dicitrate binding protein FerR (iron transport regulator)|nr:FecR family protein [Prolixibacteraceae bacterium]